MTHKPCLTAHMIIWHWKKCPWLEIKSVWCTNKIHTLPWIIRIEIKGTKPFHYKQLFKLQLWPWLEMYFILLLFFFFSFSHQFWPTWRHMKYFVVRTALLWAMLSQHKGVFKAFLFYCEDIWGFCVCVLPFTITHVCCDCICPPTITQVIAVHVCECFLFLPVCFMDGIPHVANQGMFCFAFLSPEFVNRRLKSWSQSKSSSSLYHPKYSSAISPSYLTLNKQLGVQ